MTSPRRLAALVLALPVLAGITACADPIPHAEITATLTDYSLRLSPPRSDEGSVKIFVDNNGKVAHGLVFVRARSRKDLPLKADGSVDLTKVQVGDQLQPVAPGRYRIAPDLFPGHLVVFCNLVTTGPDGQTVSHFQRGMVADLTIRATSSSNNKAPAPG